jgi:hypothetical protein
MAKAGKGHYCRARIIPQSSTVGGQVACPELARNPLMAGGNISRRLAPSRGMQRHQEKTSSAKTKARRLLPRNSDFMLTPRPRTFVRLPRNIVDPANRALTYWSLAKARIIQLWINNACCRKNFLGLRNLRLHSFDRGEEARLIVSFSSVSIRAICCHLGCKTCPNNHRVKNLSFAEALLLHRKLPVPIEPSHLPDLSVILGPRSLSGLTRASSGLRRPTLAPVY